jgi:hypothetical protein
VNDAQVPKDELVKELSRGTCEYDGVDRIMDEDADEIERLRAVLQDIFVGMPLALSGLSTCGDALK